MSSHSSTPVRSSDSRPQKAKSRRPRTKSPVFTTQMQDAQARNKDPYGSDSSDSAFEGAGGRYYSYGNESYEQIQRRREAAIVLDSPELLMMHAEARNDSIAGTRYYFNKMLCGYLKESDTYEVRKAPPVEKTEKENVKLKQAKGKGKDSSAS